MASNDLRLRSPAGSEQEDGHGEDGSAESIIRLQGNPSPSPQQVYVGQRMLVGIARGPPPDDGRMCCRRQEKNQRNTGPRGGVGVERRGRQGPSGSPRETDGVFKRGRYEEAASTEGLITQGQQPRAAGGKMRKVRARGSRAVTTAALGLRG